RGGAQLLRVGGRHPGALAGCAGDTAFVEDAEKDQTSGGGPDEEDTARRSRLRDRLSRRRVPSPLKDRPMRPPRPAAVASTALAPSAPMATYAAPVAQAPMYSAPMYSAPVAQAPVYSAPMAQAPMYSAPVAQAPMYSAPVAHAPVFSAPMAPSCQSAPAHAPFA